VGATQASAEGPRALSDAQQLEHSSALAEQVDEQVDTDDIEEEPISVDELLAATSAERLAAADAQATGPRGARVGIKDAVQRDPSRTWKHSGFLLEPRIGATGCFGEHCRGSAGHDVSPGILVGGFIGGNIAGIIDIGVEGSWGRLSPGDLKGRNVFDLYGVDPAIFEDVVNTELRSYAGGGAGKSNSVDFSGLVITGSTDMSVANLGPTVRVHFIRFGRGSFYLGTGAHWQMWANSYETALGRVGLAFHGISVPVAGGLGFYPIEHLMIGAEFRYVFANYFLSVIDHPDLSTFSPMSLIDEATADAGESVSGGLPGFWNVSATMRVRF
jgi:hypothetical protein